jgi:hypothetical protein
LGKPVDFVARSALPLRTDGQLLAAHGAAAGYDGLAVGRFHASPKPVRFGASAVIRLESSFGHFVPGNIDYTTVWMVVLQDILRL